MEALEKYHDLGKKLSDSLRLTTYPVAVRMVRPGEGQPAGSIRPVEAFGDEVPACLSFNWAKRNDFCLYMTKDDIACKPIVIYFGLDETPDPDDVYCAWEKHGGYKRDAAAEKKSREKDARFKPFEYEGIAVAPLNSTPFVPHLTMIYCSPLILSHLILAATYDGGNITSHFNGMESSCKEGIIRTHNTQECQVAVPGMGDRVLGGVQDHEMIFSMPESQFDIVEKNLFMAGSQIEPRPFGIPHPNPTMGAGKLLGARVEPGVWDCLRAKFAEAKEKK